MAVSVQRSALFFCAPSYVSQRLRTTLTVSEKFRAPELEALPPLEYAAIFEPGSRTTSAYPTFDRCLLLDAMFVYAGFSRRHALRRFDAQLGSFSGGRLGSCGVRRHLL